MYKCSFFILGIEFHVDPKRELERSVLSGRFECA